MATENDFIKSFIKKNKNQFLKYKKYLQENDWRYFPEKTDKKQSDSKVDEFQVQNELVSAILSRLKYFVKKAESDNNTKPFKDFAKETLSIISIHTERAEDYISASNLSDIKDLTLRANEIQFHNTLFKSVSSIDDTVSALNIKEESAVVGINLFLDKQKATLAMHKILYDIYPEIRNKVDELGIDFDSPPPKTIHLLNKNPPLWNKDKHYWEQDKDTLQYYVDEYKKIEGGIIIDDYFIDGWLYFHFNHFVANIPTTVVRNGIPENLDVIKPPPLRDNEIIITEYFNKSRREGLTSLIAATRRAAKTTMNASRIVRAQLLSKKQILCAGGSSEDLGHIHNNMDTCQLNMTQAFRLYFLSPTEDGRGKVYGIKTKSNKSIATCNVFIINLEGGSNKKKQESLAGFTPDEFILDEAMKFPFKKQLDALEPALWGSGILRCSQIITGTGGNDELASDAIKMLNNPIDNRICLMDWDTLERGVPKELITWERKEFGLFLPTQMSVKHKKIESNLADYLGIISETLSQIPLLVTDWENAKIAEDKERDSKISDRQAYVRLLAYHPYDPNEIFLSGKVSPFPIAETRTHREFLSATGNWDRRRDLYRDSSGIIRIDLSSKDIVQYPHSGGIVDAPALIFEDPPKERPRYGTYIGAFDDYASEDSETDSVATFYVIKNKILGDPFSEKIVASISFRPQRHQEVYEKWLMLMELYFLDGCVFGENFNYNIKDFLDRKHLSDKYLAQSLDFTQSFSLPNNLKRKTGWSPMIKKHLFNLFVDYCNEEFQVENEEGDLITLKGVQRIDDIVLLDEIMKYSENANVDRITSAMACVSYMHYLQSSYRWKTRDYEKERDNTPQVKKEKRQLSFYNTTSRSSSFYSIKNRR